MPIRTKSFGKLVVDDFLPKQTNMRAAGKFVIARIKQRTGMGFDEDGKKFKPYSPGYAAMKGVSRGNVTLRKSGQMLREMKVLKVSRTSVTVGFSSLDMRHRAEKNEVTRRFLGMADSWLKEIKAIIFGTRR